MHNESSPPPSSSHSARTIKMHRIEEGRSWLSKHLKIGIHHHHDHPKFKPPSSSLQTYESSLSIGLSQLISSAESQSLAPSLAWAHQAVIFLISTHCGLQTLAGEINHPFEKWGFSLTDEYLADTLNLLDLLNSLSRNLFLISQHRFHLQLSAGSPLTAPTKEALQEWMAFATDFAASEAEPEIQEERCEIESRKTSESGEAEKVFRRAMEGAKSVNLFVMKILSCCFSGDVESMLEMKVPPGYVWSAVLMNLKMKVCEEMLNKRTRKEGSGVIFQEVVDVNERVGRLLSYISSKEEERKEGPQGLDDGCDEGSDEILSLKVLIEDVEEKVEVLGNRLDALVAKMDRLFSVVFRARNDSLDALKRKNV